jgi:hypothetical protein
MTAPKTLIRTGEDLDVEVSRGKRFAFWDELRGVVTSRFPGGPSANSLAPYGWLALLILTNAVVSTLSGAHDSVQRGGSYDLLRPGYFEGTSVICTLSLLPLFRRGVHLIGRCRSWITRLTLASLLASIYAVAHIAILIPIRKSSFGILGGTYTFNWVTQGPYDFRREIIAAMVLGGAFWLFDRKTIEPESPAAGVEATPADGAYLWLRDGTTAVRIDPRAIVTVTSAGNYVEFSLTDKSYLIRATLAGEETRLQPFGVRRVHRTRLVNFNRVVAIEPRPGGDFNLRMDNGEQIAGSRRYRDAVKTMTAAV